MSTLFSYPELYGVEDNNLYGLKVFAFLKLCCLPFDHRHILDLKSAPRGQHPYIVDGEEAIGDGDAIDAYLKRKYDLTIDNVLTNVQQDLDLLVRRTLDDLYWVMSYSRWRARKYNFERYHYQGIGRFAPEDVYARGIADLRVIANMIDDNGFIFGPEPVSIDASVYGFVANIYFYEIDTALKQFVSSRPNLVRHCHALRAAVDRPP